MRRVGGRGDERLEGGVGEWGRGVAGRGGGVGGGPGGQGERKGSRRRVGWWGRGLAGPVALGLAVLLSIKLELVPGEAHSRSLSGSVR